MPRLSVWFVRASLLYLLAGVTFGALLLANKGIAYYPPIWNLFPIHIEFLLVGWLVQLALGVAFWILPRFSRGAPRGDERWIRGAFLFLNLGILLTVLQSKSSYALMSGRLLEVGGILIYLIGTWRRVKPHGT